MSLLTQPPFIHLVVPAVAVPGDGDAAVLHPIVDVMKSRTDETELSVEIVDLTLEFQLQPSSSVNWRFEAEPNVAATGRLYLSFFADGLFSTVSLLPVLDLFS